MDTPIPVDLGPDPSGDHPGLRRIGTRWQDSGSSLNLHDELYEPDSLAGNGVTIVYLTTRSGNVYRLTRDAACVNLNVSLEKGYHATAEIDAYDRCATVGSPFRFRDPYGRVHTTSELSSIVATDGRYQLAADVRARTGGVSDRVGYSTETELQGLTGAPVRGLLAVGRKLRSGNSTPHSAQHASRAA